MHLIIKISQTNLQLKTQERAFKLKIIMIIKKFIQQKKSFKKTRKPRVGIYNLLSLTKCLKGFFDRQKRKVKRNQNDFWLFLVLRITYFLLKTVSANRLFHNYRRFIQKMIVQKIHRVFRDPQHTKKLKKIKCFFNLKNI